MVNFLKLSFLLFSVSLVCSVPIPDVPTYPESSEDSNPIIFQDNVEQINQDIPENMNQIPSRRLLKSLKKTIGSILPMNICS